MSRSEVFFVNHPEMLLIGQHNGEIVALDTPARFNKHHGRYAHTKIRPLHHGELYFSNRQMGPHLQLARNEFGHQVFDISEIGLLA